LRCRHLDWQRTSVLPLQEMFGQVGIGRFWDPKPAFPKGALAVTGSDLKDMASRRSCDYHRATIQETQEDVLAFRRCKSRSL
jgi:hypothetical protein